MVADCRSRLLLTQPGSWRHSNPLAEIVGVPGPFASMTERFAQDPGKLSPLERLGQQHPSRPQDTNALGRLRRVARHEDNLGIRVVLFRCLRKFRPADTIVAAPVIERACRAVIAIQKAQRPEALPAARGEHQILQQLQQGWTAGVVG